MPNNLLALPGGLPWQAERQAGRELAHIDRRQLVALRRDEARLERVAITAQRGMVRAAELGVLEANLCQMAPSAAGYIHASAIAGAIGIAGVVHESTRGL